jgi:hypothetical protein
MPAMKKGMTGKDTVRVSMKMNAGRQSMNISGVLSMNPLAGQFDMSGAAFGGRMKMILAKDTVYVSTPDLPAGKYLLIDPNSGDAMAESIGEMLQEMDPTKTYDDLVYTIWMGSTDHLMYKVFFELGGASVTMTATDWGKPVHISAPPVSKVVAR